MFKTNVGSIDRVLRIIVGLALLAGFYVFPDTSLRMLFLLGIIPLATGVAGTCPVYSLLGIRTCPART